MALLEGTAQCSHEYHRAMIGAWTSPSGQPETKKSSGASTHASKRASRVTAVPYHCECGDGSCFETVALMPSEYEQVLRERYRFMIVPGHENPAIERVVEHHSTHLVVEKIGEARDQLDRDHRRARAARALRMTTSNGSPSSTLTGSEPA
jgi:hypothetical protein